MARTRTCSNDVYTVAFPAGWHTNDGRTLPRPCLVFDPESFQVQEDTEISLAYAAVFRVVDGVPFDRLTGNVRGRRVIARRDTQVAGRNAVVTETRATEESPLVPPGTVTYRYAVNLPEGVLLASTHDVGRLDFATEKKVLDAMMDSFGLTGQPGDGDDGTRPPEDEEPTPPFPANTEPDAARGDGPAVSVTDIDVGRHRGFDRVVFELGGVAWRAGGHVTSTGPSGRGPASPWTWQATPRSAFS